MSPKKEIIIALLGNPNSGKTSLFNVLVGANQKVGNFPGVTVEKIEGILKCKNYQLRFIDLPGTYSLTAYSPEELITRDYIIKEKPDIVIDVVDSTNLDRHLYLTTQIIELGCKTILALNMYDELQKQQIKLDIQQLQTLLGIPITPTSAVQKTGLSELLDQIILLYEAPATALQNKMIYRPEITEKAQALSAIIQSIKDLTAKYSANWLAIKLLEQDKQVYQLLKEYPAWLQLEIILKANLLEFKDKFQTDPETMLTEDRYAFINGALKETVIMPHLTSKSWSERIDTILINRILGFPIFLGIMWLVFQFTFKLGAIPMHWLESLFNLLGQTIAPLISNDALRSIIVDGVIAGVGGVLVFLPNILLLFIALTFLEGTGYMARTAFVVDKVMHVFGLHGKSFIPMMTGFGCSIPAIMATRTLKNRSDALTTMLIIPFMSCGARLPVYMLLISAFFPVNYAGNVLFGIYLFGIAIALLSAMLLKNTILKGDTEPFVMELPPYRLPTLKAILIQVQIKASLYLKKAGTVILVASLLIWLASNFPQDNALKQQHRNQVQNILITQPAASGQADLIASLNHQYQAKQLEYSMAGRFGKFIAPVLQPLGFDWKISVALSVGLAAKEVIVSGLSTIYALNETSTSTADLGQSLRRESGFNLPKALSLMIFVLLYVPCVATLGVLKKETGKWKWVLFYVVYSLSVAWVAAFIVYRIALLFTGFF